MRNIPLIFILTLLSFRVEAVLIPAAHLGSWAYSTNVGVPGGIPARTVTRNVHTTYGGDKTGVTNADSAIAAAESAASDGDVIYFPAGIYYCTGYHPTKHIVIRGESPTNTILDMHNSGQSTVHFGSDTQSPWIYTNAGVVITNGLTKGSSSLQVTSSAGFAVGQIAIISEKDTNDLANNFVSVDVTVALSGLNVRQQKSLITNVSGINLGIDPPLMWTMNASLTPRVTHMTGDNTNFGVESINISMTNSTAAYGIWFEECRSSWASNVWVTRVQNGIVFGTSFQCEARNCLIGPKTGSGNNHSGFLLDRCGSMLLEDNITIDVFPHYEINGTSGSVFAYNFLHISEDSGLISMSMDGNHGPHSQFNLFEGNVGPKFGADGFFGSSSDCTVLRNWWHGTDPRTNQYSVCIQLLRFTRYYNLVGNILGATNYSYSYDNNYGMSDGAYSTRYFYNYGLPNIGNPASNGTNAPPWVDFGGNWGSASGTGGQYKFQERDTNVLGSLVIKGNYNSQTSGIPAREDPGSDTVPNSYFRSSKPSYFQGLDWPLDGTAKTWVTATNSLYTVAIIPAQARYFGLPITAGPAPYYPPSPGRIRGW